MIAKDLEGGLVETVCKVVDNSKVLVVTENSNTQLGDVLQFPLSLILFYIRLNLT